MYNGALKNRRLLNLRANNIWAAGPIYLLFLVFSYDRGC